MDLQLAPHTRSWLPSHFHVSATGHSRPFLCIVALYTALAEKGMAWLSPQVNLFPYLTLSLSWVVQQLMSTFLNWRYSLQRLTYSIWRMILWSIPGKNSWVGVWALMNRMVLPLYGRYNQCQKDSLKNQVLHGSGHSSRLILQQPSVRNRALHPWWFLHLETFIVLIPICTLGDVWLLQWGVLIKPCALLDFAYTRIKSIKNVTRCRDSRTAKSIETR